MLHFLQGWGSTQSIWNSSLQDICLCSFIHSFIFVSINWWIFNSTQFCCWNCFTLAIGSSFQMASVSLWYTPSYRFFLPELFYFLYYKILQAYLIYFLSISLRSFLLSEYGIINQNLGTRCAHCYWGCCFYALSVDRTRTHVYINPCIYINTYNYFHM